MSRIEPIPKERYNEAQRRLHDTVAARRGNVGGPFDVLLHVPDIGERVAGFVDHLLSDSRVPHKLKELAILTIAREYTAQYEWVVHEVRARQFGLGDAVIEAIRHRRPPEFADLHEAVVHAMAREIVTERQLGDDHYARAVEALGEAAVVELVALIGFYIAIAVLLVSYRVAAPQRDGASSLPE